jgi:NTP pyrophosphatase (non-canonical NTP hydrolase)
MRALRPSEPVLRHASVSVVSHPEAAQTESIADSLGVVVCGSFRRNVDELKADLAELMLHGCRILSPKDAEFVAEVDGFVFAEHELGRRPADIERDHVDAIRSCDFVWLHSPDGYVGPSAAFELGVAATAGIPVFGRLVPEDVALREWIVVADSPSAAAESQRARSLQEAGAPLTVLQRYYSRAAQARGWDQEGPADSMLLLTEEVGELARAVRKHVGLGRDGASPGGVDEELADVQLYVVHLANILGVDLSTAVTAKERENLQRFQRRVERAA